MNNEGRTDAPKYDRHTTKGRGMKLEKKRPADARCGDLVQLTCREYNTRHEPTNRLWTRWVRKTRGRWWAS